MYDIPYFKAADHDEVIVFMKAHPFIILCGSDVDGTPVATHLPVLIEEREGKIFLLAHIMRKQEHTVAFEKNANVLAIFYGEHRYISASWYETKNVASTWNYQAVHAKGIIHFLEEEDLYQLLIKLTDHFESNPHSPASVHTMDKTYVNNMMKAIVAFEIEITRLNHVFKLSQNKDPKTIDTIVSQLKSGNSDVMVVAEKIKDQQNCDAKLS